MRRICVERSDRKHRKAMTLNSLRILIVLLAMMSRPLI